MGRSITAERIKQRREELNIAVSELATRLSMSKATIHRYESGEIQNIKMPVIYMIAKELNVSSSWLLGKVDDMEELDTREAFEKYQDLDVLFDDLIMFFNAIESLKSHGKTLTKCDRVILADGMDLLKRAVLDKYK